MHYGTPGSKISDAGAGEPLHYQKKTLLSLRHRPFNFHFRGGGAVFFGKKLMWPPF